MRFLVTPILTFLILSAAPVGGAELQLRARCQPQGAVVTLGDVAEVIAADRREAESLAAVELFTAPAAGQQRVVRLRDLQDLLATRQINMAEHRFSRGQPGSDRNSRRRGVRRRGPRSLPPSASGPSGW